MKRARYYWPLSYSSDESEEDQSHRSSSLPSLRRREDRTPAKSISSSSSDSSSNISSSSSSSESSSSSGSASSSSSSSNIGDRSFDGSTSISASDNVGDGGGKVGGDSGGEQEHGDPQSWRSRARHGAGRANKVENPASDSGSCCSHQTRIQGKEEEGRQEEKEGNQEEEEEDGKVQKEEVSKEWRKRIRQKFASCLYGRRIQPVKASDVTPSSAIVNSVRRRKMISTMDALCFLALKNLIWMGEECVSVNNLREIYSELFFILGTSLQDVCGMRSEISAPLATPSLHLGVLLLKNLQENSGKEDGGNNVLREWQMKIAQTEGGRMAHALINVMSSTPEVLSHALSMFYISEENVHRRVEDERNHCVYCLIREIKKNL